MTRDLLLESHLLKVLPLPSSTTLGTELYSQVLEDTYPDPLVGYCGHFS